MNIKRTHASARPPKGMQPLQLLSAGIALAHACLLAGVYFATSVHTDAFVSTQIHAAASFRVALTLLVLAETGLCSAYAYYLHRDSQGATAAAAVLVAGSVAGWCLVASFPTDRAEHGAGAALFIAATGGYSWFFIAGSEKWRPALYFLWASAAAAAAAFGALYLAQLYQWAAALEWAAFTLAAITLCLFFLANPPEKLRGAQQRRTPPPESAMPLLHPSAFG